jgi:anaerobic magnesium-protoporphyrin IX monomethyl ester cyclase
MVRIALVKPPYPYASFYKVPLGLAYLQSVLIKNGYESEIIDGYNFNLETEKIIQKLDNYRPDIIGISANTPEIISAALLAAEIKKSFKVPIALGGPHITALPIETFNEFPIFDYGIYGEGEISFLKLVNNLAVNDFNFSSIPNLVYRTGNQCVVNPRGEYLNKDALDELPFPNLDVYYHAPGVHSVSKNPLSDLGSWKTRGYTIITSRGCPYHCVFCMRVLGNQVRRRSPLSVMDEIEYAIHRYNVDSIFFADEIFLTNSESTLELLQLMQIKGLKRQIKWSAMTRVDIVNKSLVENAREAGCVSLHLGVESGNNDILKNTGKGINTQQVIDAVSIIKSAGISTTSFFILGHPGESIKTLNDTVRLASKINSDNIAVGIMIPYPGTEVYKRALNNEGGYRLLSTDWSRYDKYDGSVLEVSGLSPNILKYFQFKTYILVYLMNRRFIDFLKIAWRYRQTVKYLLTNWLVKSKGKFRPEQS